MFYLCTFLFQVSSLLPPHSSLISNSSLLPSFWVTDKTLFLNDAKSDFSGKNLLASRYEKGLNTPNFARRDLESTSPLITRQHVTEKYEPEYVNLRPYGTLSAEYSSSDAERANYSNYLSQQFNKLRDATLSRNFHSSHLSYPPKEALFSGSRLSAMTEQSLQGHSKHLLKFPERPHSCIELQPTQSTETSKLKKQANVYEVGSRLSFPLQNYSRAVEFRDQYLPEYIKPPDYSFHRHSKEEYVRYPDHESSAPPVILRDTSTDHERPRGYYGSHEQCSSLNASQELQPKRSSRSPFDTNSGESIKRFSLPPYPLPSQQRSSPPLNNSFSHQRLSATPSPRISREIETEASKGNPPPYHSHHEILDSRPAVSDQNASQNETFSSVSSVPKESVSSSSKILDFTMPTSSPPEFCKKNHPPSASCKSCNNSRSNYRKNAANLVRRASSGASLLKRKSAKLRSSFHTEVDLEETPSILARLRKEWQDRKGSSKSAGNISSPLDSKNSDSHNGIPSSNQSRSTESIGYELPNLSEHQWTIKENQAMGYTSPPFGALQLSHSAHSSQINEINAASPKCDNLPPSRERLLDLSRKSPSKAQSGVRASDAAISDSSLLYFEVDISDSDSTYDTLIIKDLSDLNETQSIDESTCSENCTQSEHKKHS